MPAVLQPTQVFATQNPLAGSAVHWPSATHCTHWPAAVPTVAQTILPSVRLAQPVAPSVSQPVQALFTQKALPGDTVHWLSPAHSTHCPMVAPVVAHTGLVPAQATAPAVWQPAHCLVTQNPLLGSAVQSVAATQPTHWAFKVSQTGVVPEQCLLATQVTHRPLVGSQAGVPVRPVQSRSVAHLTQT